MLWFRSTPSKPVGTANPSSSLPHDTECLSFTGTDDPEVTVFLQRVLRVALEHERHRDGDWICGYVASCLSGDAYRFYADLDEADKLNWQKLQKVLIQQYKSEVTAPDPPMAAAPIPFSPSQARPPALSQIAHSPLVKKASLSPGTVITA